MLFVGQGRYRVRQSVYALSFLVTLDSGLVLGGAVGPNMGGQIEALDGDRVTERWEIRPGVVWSFNVARRFFGDEPKRPFLLVVGTLSGSSASTRRESDGDHRGLHGLDFKVDLSAGWTLGGAWSPYLAVRAFGGPAFWHPGDEAAIGTDLYHVSLALGYSLTLGRRVSAHFDAAVLGMRGLSGGLALHF